MSSILDALAKVEATGTPRTAPAGIVGRPQRRRPWVVIALVVGAVAVGAGGAALVLGLRAPAEPVVTPAVPAAPPPVVVAQVSTTVAVPTLPPTTLAAAPPPAPAPAPAAVAPVPRVAAPVPPPVAADPLERPLGADPDVPKTPPSTAMVAVARATPPPTLPPAPPRVKVEEAPPPRPRGLPIGAPRMRVSFLVYSSVAERRSVILTIDGGSLTTLREGDEANGVAVLRIHPDRVELRWEGETFTLEVRS